MRFQKEVQGIIKDISDDGLVKICYVSSIRYTQDICAEFVLQGLEFFTGTKALKRFLETGVIHKRTDVFTLRLGEPLSTTHEDVARVAYPRQLCLYQDFEFGRVDVNKIIGMGVTKMYKSWIQSFKKGRLGATEMSFVKADSTGTVWLQFKKFQERILNFGQPGRIENAGVMPETFESLANKINIGFSVFLVPFSKTNSYQRALVKTARRRSLQVHFFDFGETVNVPFENIYDASRFSESFARFPAICIKCSLHGLVSLDVSELEDLLDGKKLFVEVHHRERTDVNNNNIRDKPAQTNQSSLAVNLFFDGDDGNRTWVNEVVVNTGIGVPAISDAFAGQYYLTAFKELQTSERELLDPRFKVAVA